MVAAPAVPGKNGGAGAPRRRAHRRIAGRPTTRLQEEIAEHRRVAAELEWKTAFLEAKADSSTPNSATDGNLGGGSAGPEEFFKTSGRLIC